MAVTEARNIYLAGKIAKGDWRHDLVPGLRGDHGRPWPVLDRAIWGLYNYVGPFFIACDHGCYHGPDRHGVGATDGASRHDHSICTEERFLGPHMDGASNRAEVFRECLHAMLRADTVFAWLDDTTAYGTLVELGFARAYVSRIIIAAPERIRDLWFAYELADVLIFGKANPLDAFAEAFPRRWSKERYAEYLQSDHWRAIRQRALTRALNRCQICNGAEALHVHHRTYERLGAEHLEDLTVLCAVCHQRAHPPVETVSPPRVKRLCDIKVGDGLTHGKFGRCLVVNLKHLNDDTDVTIKSADGVIRTLSWNFARLEKLGASGANSLT